MHSRYIVVSWVSAVHLHQVRDVATELVSDALYVKVAGRLSCKPAIERWCYQHVQAFLMPSGIGFLLLA